jgi:hypothetical protein
VTGKVSWGNSECRGRSIEVAHERSRARVVLADTARESALRPGQAFGFSPFDNPVYAGFAA